MEGTVIVNIGVVEFPWLAFTSCKEELTSTGTEVGSGVPSGFSVMVTLPNTGWVPGGASGFPVEFWANEPLPLKGEEK
jgi:hypothetical protein